MAIAAHLGIEAPGFEPGGVRRAVRREADVRERRGAGPVSRGDQPRDGGGAGSDAHAVVRTVARRLSGRLKQYHESRGFGFVVSPDTPGDVFFHRSDCRVDPATLAPSGPLTFDLVEMANGQFKAVNLAPRT